MSTVAIVTLAGDLHARVISRQLQDVHGVDVAVVASDTLSGAGGLTWSNVAGPDLTLPTEDGGTVSVADLDLVWWRRCHGRPTVPDGVTDPQMRKLVVKDNRAGLRGLLMAGFTGTWISDPYETERAQNKILVGGAFPAPALPGRGPEHEPHDPHRCDLPDPSGHRRAGLLPAQARRGQAATGGDPVLEAQDLRRPLSPARHRRRSRRDQGG